MVLLYSIVLLSLGAIKLLITFRATRLADRFAQAALAAAKLAGTASLRGGNTSKPDLCQEAQRLYLLALLVQKRDRLEVRHHFWQGHADRVQAWVTWLRNWKGKKLPYTLGAIDVSCLFGLADTLGAGQYVNVRHVYQFVAELLSR